ncbi:MULTISPECIES: hypothetical protein [unclassified Streptomyces]|uniref:hypothetical protein n=1 Tax=unclassified Streptomyces TaxID=2593676 RepID=UPI00331A8706
MRLYRHVDDPGPGVGDRGGMHLIQLWPAPVHLDISEADRQARADYAEDMTDPAANCTAAYACTDGGEPLVLGVVDDRVVDRAVPLFPDELHRSLLGQRREDRADIGDQIGPDGQQGARPPRPARTASRFSTLLPARSEGLPA